MWINLFLATSNLYALRGIQACIQKRQYILAFLLFSSMNASMVYHATEQHQHKLSGISIFPVTEEVEETFLRLDRFFAIITGVSSALQNGWERTTECLPLALKALGVTIISEIFGMRFVMVGWESEIYAVLHSLWHILAFHVIYVLVR